MFMRCVIQVTNFDGCMGVWVWKYRIKWHKMTCHGLQTVLILRLSSGTHQQLKLSNLLLTF